MKCKQYPLSKTILFLSLLFCFIAFNDVNALDSSKDVDKKEADVEKEKSGNEVPLSAEIVVKGKRENFFERKGKEPYQERTVNKKGIERLGGASQTNSLMPLQTLPSVNIQSPDAYGLDKGQAVNIRGKNSYHLCRNVDSVPIQGGHYFGAQGDIIDLENIESTTLYSGAVPANKGFGFSNAGGVINMIMLKPSDTFSTQVKQSVGTYDFTKTYARVDSGKMPWGTSIFASGSYTYANQWRGDGFQQRQNAEIGLTQTILSRLYIEAYGIWSRDNGHNYRNLTYEQAKNISDSDNYKYSYNDKKTYSAQDWAYKDYNKQRYTEQAVFGKAVLSVFDNGKLFLKPYYIREDGLSISGTSKLSNVRAADLNRPGVTYWYQKHDTYGGVLSYDHTFKGHSVSLGHWYQSMQPPPPPSNQKAYRIQNNGSLTFAGWNNLAKFTDHKSNSPFVNLESNIGNLMLTGGVRYLIYREPSYKYYDGRDLADANGDDVWDQNPSIRGGMICDGKTFREWLPNAGVSYSFGSDAVVRANYARGYGRQNWGSVPATYYAFESQFNAAGITFQDLWRKLRLEIVDNFDLGMRYNKESWYVEPSVFYAMYRHKQVKIYDPTIGTGVYYFESSAKARSYGAELTAGVSPAKNFTIFSSGAYDNYTFSDDVKTSSSNVVHAKGNQVPDCPKWSATAGLEYKIWDISVSPIARYVDLRYGNMENNQWVPSYITADLNIAYKKDSLFGIKDFTAGISVTNLFNRKYVGTINWTEYQYDGSGTYAPAAPLTVIFTVSGKV